jgi:hypothetical protein
MCRRGGAGADAIQRISLAVCVQAVCVQAARVQYEEDHVHDFGSRRLWQPGGRFGRSGSSEFIFAYSSSGKRQPSFVT